MLIKTSTTRRRQLQEIERLLKHRNDVPCHEEQLEIAIDLKGETHIRREVNNHQSIPVHVVVQLEFVRDALKEGARYD